MPTYIMLTTLTPEGVQTIKNNPARIREVNGGVAPDDVGAVVDAASAAEVDLVIVGPEAPLVGGVADALAAAGIRCFGPSAAGAALEGSKAFCKEIMVAAGVPTASHAVVTEV